MTPRVPFLALRPGPDAPAIRAAIDRVIERGWFVLGPELTAFEQEFAAFSGARYGVGVGTGTDAIALTLRALGIGPGDEVITSPLSAAYSAIAILMAGATPVFADISPDRLTLDPGTCEAAITPRTAALLPVHLYGQAADMAAFSAIAERHGLMPARRTAPRRPAARSAPSARPARSVSIPRRISAPSATPARSSPTMPRWPQSSGACGTAARPTGIAMWNLVSTAGWTKCRRPCCGRG
jgi:hypothetical protein